MQLVDALKQRYLLQDVGLELFASDGDNALLVFERAADRDAVLAQLALLCPALSSPDSLYRVSREAKMEKVGALGFDCFP